MGSTGDLFLVFTAQSKRAFYCRDSVCEFVLKNGGIPLNPFRIFEYFLHNRVEDEMVRRGNNYLISRADELWVFGKTIADGVLTEVCYAKKLKKPIRYFTIHRHAAKIKEISVSQLTFEKEVYAKFRIHGRDRREKALALIMGEPGQRTLFDLSGQEHE